DNGNMSRVPFQLKLFKQWLYPPFWVTACPSDCIRVLAFSERHSIIIHLASPLV
ncbi:hypothetical protein STEG23_025589, partial [Scotinomys teguina]